MKFAGADAAANTGGVHQSRVIGWSHQFNASTPEEVPADSFMAQPRSSAPHFDTGGARSCNWLTHFGNGPQMMPELPATPIVTYWWTCLGW